MAEENFKARVKNQTRKSLTAKGVGYRKVRSKHTKGKDGYGKVIIEARERLIARNKGKDPGKDTVAAHYSGGPHFEKGGGRARFLSRAKNTAESNRARKR
jgi:hypothetical protein